MNYNRMLKGCLFFIICSLLHLGLKAQQASSNRLYKAIESKQYLLSKKLDLTKKAFFQKASSLYKKPFPDSLLPRKTMLSVDNVLLSSLISSKADLLKIEIPLNEKTFSLVLMKQEFNATNNTQLTNMRQTIPGGGLHYRGYVDGDSSSIATLSVFDDGTLVGLFANTDGNFVLTKLKDSEQYIAYNDQDMKKRWPFNCYTDDRVNNTSMATEKIRTAGTPSVTSATDMPCKIIRCYWEADYVLYQKFNMNYAATQNYIYSLFNQVSAVFQNEGINLELSAFKIWTTEDPYRNDNTANALTDFSNFWHGNLDNFNGDLAFLLSGKYDGGLAYLNGLCNRYYAYAMVGNSSTTVSPWTSYSYDVYAVAHEIGHNFGSPHTQSCSWSTGPNGECGAIDDCAALEDTWQCASCKPLLHNADPVTAWQGSIMSYCHLTSRGISMAGGFGLLPGNYIRGSIYYNSGCLQTIPNCGSSTNCMPPFDVAHYRTESGNNIILDITWRETEGALSYTLEYKRTTDQNWTIVPGLNGTNYRLVLNGGADYYYRVKTKCASGESYPSVEQFISSMCPAPNLLGVANITATSAILSWGNLDGGYVYTIQYWADQPGSALNESYGIRTSSYMLFNLKPNTTYLFKVRKTCASSSSLYTSAGSFKTLSVGLPLTLEKFNGNRKGNDNLLQWVTYDEVHTDRFEIEYSTDGQNFQLAGTVAAAGNSSSSLSYHFTHSPVYESAFYRLKMIDIDGSVTYSQVIFIAATTTITDACLQLQGNVYPIPFEGRIILPISACKSQNATITLTSIDGRILKKEKTTIKKGVTAYTINGLGSLISGTYVLQVIPEYGNSIVKKIEKL